MDGDLVHMYIPKPNGSIGDCCSGGTLYFQKFFQQIGLAGVEEEGFMSVLGENFHLLPNFSRERKEMVFRYPL
jgi:hypothetical protein